MITLILVQVPLFVLTEEPAEVSIEKSSSELETLEILLRLEGYRLNLYEPAIDISHLNIEFVKQENLETGRTS